MKNHLNICNTTNKFLTSYEEYIQSRHNSKSFTKAGEIINSTCFNEAIIKNYKEDNNNICFEIEIEGKDNKIYTYKIELINIQKIYTRDFVCLPPSYISAEEMIKENYRIPYKEVSSIKERIESDNILNTIFIASYEDIPICVYIQMDWSVHEHKILCQDIKTSIHNSQKL